MKTARIVALSLALLGAFVHPASAATTDYVLDIPLVSWGAADLTAFTGSLTGTLSLDDDAMAGYGIGTGSFSLVSAENQILDTSAYSGTAGFMLLSDGNPGVSFDGQTDQGGSLYFNLATGVGSTPVISGPVSYCGLGGSSCTFFEGVNATMTPAQFTPVTTPGIGLTVGVSPVPLPPAVSLFGSALLALAGLGVGRRLKPRFAILRG